MLWHRRWHLIDDSLEGWRGNEGVRGEKLNEVVVTEQQHGANNQTIIRVVYTLLFMICTNVGKPAEYLDNFSPFVIKCCHGPRAIFHNLTSPVRRFLWVIYLPHFNFEKSCCGEKDEFYFAPEESMSGSHDLQPPVIVLDRHFFTLLLKLREDQSFFPYVPFAVN